MDPPRYLTRLFKISSKIGKNDALYQDISNIVHDYDIPNKFSLDILISAIRQCAHASIIELLGNIIEHIDLITPIRIRDQHGHPYKIVASLYDYINMLYHNHESERAYYDEIAVILGYEIIKPYDVREKYIDELMSNPLFFGSCR
jgi:hypothetical protein